MQLAHLKRLWQPGRLLFWQMVFFNIMSSVCAWAMRTLPLNTVALLLVGFVALLNVVFGLLAAWMLMREPLPAPPGEDGAGPTQH
jgi:ABC-type sulfate transport system permease component